MEKRNTCLPGCRSGSCSRPEGNIVPIFDKKKEREREREKKTSQASRSLSPSSRPRTKNGFNDRFARHGAEREPRERNAAVASLSLSLFPSLSMCTVVAGPKANDASCGEKYALGLVQPRSARLPIFIRRCNIWPRVFERERERDKERERLGPTTFVHNSQRTDGRMNELAAAAAAACAPLFLSPCLSLSLSFSHILFSLAVSFFRSPFLSPSLCLPPFLLSLYHNEAAACVRVGVVRQ